VPGVPGARMEVPPPAPGTGHRHVDPWRGDCNATVVFVLRRHRKSDEAGLTMRAYLPISAAGASADPAPPPRAAGLMAGRGMLHVLRNGTSLVAR